MPHVYHSLHLCLLYYTNQQTSLQMRFFYLYHHVPTLNPQMPFLLSLLFKINCELFDFKIFKMWWNGDNLWHFLIFIKSQAVKCNFGSIWPHLSLHTRWFSIQFHIDLLCHRKASLVWHCWNFLAKCLLKPTFSSLSLV